MQTVSEDDRNTIQWIMDALKKKQIKNIALDDIQILFPEQYVDISDYLLVNVGYTKDRTSKTATFLQLLACEPDRNFLQGPHEVKIYLPTIQEDRTMWVYSLTCLRKHFLDASDRLSFERSTFLVHQDSHSLVRLKCLRSQLILPQRKRDYFDMLYFSPTTVTTYSIDVLDRDSKPRAMVKKENITLRTKNQVKHSLEQILTSYIRDLNQAQTRGQIIGQFQQDVIHIMSTLY